MLKIEEHLQYIKSLVDAKKAGVAGVEENILTAVTTFENKFINPKTSENPAAAMRRIMDRV